MHVFKFHSVYYVEFSTDVIQHLRKKQKSKVFNSVPDVMQVHSPYNMTSIEKQTSTSHQYILRVTHNIILSHA